MKVRVITDCYEYMGLKKGIEADITEIAPNSKVAFIMNMGKEWALNPSQYEVIDSDECRSSYCECEEGKCSGGKVDMRADEAEKLKKKDMVNSPSHYALFDDIEAIQVIASSMTKEMFKGYCFGNLLKYKLRAGSKDDIQQELKKADKYKELYEKYQHLCKQTETTKST